MLRSPLSSPWYLEGTELQTIEVLGQYHPSERRESRLKRQIRPLDAALPAPAVFDASHPRWRRREHQIGE